MMKEMEKLETYKKGLRPAQAMDLLQRLCFCIKYVIHMGAVYPTKINPEAITEVRHGDGIGCEVVAAKSEGVCVHVVYSGGLLC
jgi:hypothetical protein